MNSHKLSIIICTYNRCFLLKETIDSILQHIDPAHNFELLIVDNNSNDETQLICSEYLNNKSFRYILEGNQGLSNARNRGIKESDGEHLVFLDDDIVVNEFYFPILIKTFKTADIVGGKVLPYKVEIPEWLPKKYYYLVSVFDVGDEIKSVRRLMGANYAMRKSVALKVGLYNVALGRNGNNLMGGEENDYLDRALALGFVVTYNPKLVVLHKINNKLDQNYVLNYAFENGRSDATIQIRNAKGLFLLKIIKAMAWVSVYFFFGRIEFKVSVKTYIKINYKYSLGYLQILKNNFYSK
jgi:glycosyltransferase involved in cell wall biosynthesis